MIEEINAYKDFLNGVKSRWAAMPSPTSKPLGTVFANKWDGNNVSQETSTNSKFTFLKAIPPLLGAIVAPIIAFPAGLAVTAMLGLPALGVVVKTKIDQNKAEGQKKELDQNLKSMQTDIREIQQRSQAVSKVVNRVASVREFSDDERVQALESIKRETEEFFAETLGVKIADLRSGKISRLDKIESTNDFTARDVARDVLADIDSAIADIGIVQTPTTTDLGGVGKTINKGIEPPVIGDGGGR